MRNIKLLSFAIASAALLISCGNKKPSFDDVVVKDAELAISNEDMSSLDSIADEIKNTEEKNLSTGLSIGAFALNDLQKKEKPDYLMALSTVSKATNDIEKIRMLSVLVAERSIARAFEMPYESYNELINKLSSDLEFPTFNRGLSDMSTADAIAKERETITKQYQSMKKNGTEEHFWAYYQTAQVEFFYLL